MITSPMVTVKITIMGAMMLGSTCRKRIWRMGTPTALAARKLHIFLDADDRTSRDSRAADATGNAQNEDDLQLTLADQRHNRDQNEQPREGHPGVDKPLHHDIDLAAEEPGRRTDQQGDHQVDTGCGEANDHRNACPMDDSTEDGLAPADRHPAGIARKAGHTCPAGESRSSRRGPAYRRRCRRKSSSSTMMPPTVPSGCSRTSLRKNSIKRERLFCSVRGVGSICYFSHVFSVS